MCGTLAVGDILFVKTYGQMVDIGTTSTTITAMEKEQLAILQKALPGDLAKVLQGVLRNARLVEPVLTLCDVTLLEEWKIILSQAAHMKDPAQRALLIEIVYGMNEENVEKEEFLTLLRKMHTQEVVTFCEQLKNTDTSQWSEMIFDKKQMKEREALAQKAMPKKP